MFAWKIWRWKGWKRAPFFSIIKPYFRGTLCTICGLLFVEKKNHYSKLAPTPRLRDGDGERQNSSGPTSYNVNEEREQRQCEQSSESNSYVLIVSLWLCYLKHKNNRVGACRTARFCVEHASAVCYHWPALCPSDLQICCSGATEERHIQQEALVIMQTQMWCGKKIQ